MVDVCDPEGLEGDRIDPDGFKWSDREHHQVPRQVARDKKWDKAAKEIFDQAKLPTPNGHNNRAHGFYNREVEVEMEEFLVKHAPNGLGDLLAKEQRALAERFVDEIANTQNLFIKGFNSEVGGGPSAIDKWYNRTGKNIVLKHTGQTAAAGARISKGIAKTVRVAGKVSKAVPVASSIIVGATSLAEGKSINEASIDVSV